MSELLKVVLICVFALCVVGGGILHYLALRAPRVEESRNAEQPEGPWPKWKRRQAGQNAEREKLEGEIRELKERCAAESAQKTNFQKEIARAKEEVEELENKLAEAAKPDSGLRSRTLAMCDKLRTFQRERGPKPKVERQLPESKEEFMERFRKTVSSWQEGYYAFYRLKLAQDVLCLRDEIRIQADMSDADLDRAISLVDINPYGTVDAVEMIRNSLWKMASDMND
jgi:hypothetical protein